MKVLTPVDIKGVRHDSRRSVVSTTSPSIVFSAAHADFRSMKLHVQTSLGTSHVARELMAIHNGTNAFFTEYALVSTNEASDAMDDVFTVDIDGSKFRLRITPSNAATRTIVVSATVL